MTWSNHAHGTADWIQRSRADAWPMQVMLCDQVPLSDTAWR